MLVIYLEMVWPTGIYLLIKKLLVIFLGKNPVTEKLTNLNLLWGSFIINLFCFLQEKIIDG